MGWDLVPPLAQVDLGHPVGVDGVALVGVHHHHKQARVGVDHLGLCSSAHFLCSHFVNMKNMYI